MAHDNMAHDNMTHDNMTHDNLTHDNIISEQQVNISKHLDLTCVKTLRCLETIVIIGACCHFSIYIQYIATKLTKLLYIAQGLLGTDIDIE